MWRKKIRNNNKVIFYSWSKANNRAATACDVSTHASGHRPQRPSIGLLPKCRAEKKKSKKILFFWLKSSDAAIHTGWRIFYVHVITLLLWKIFKGIATGMRFALSFKADQFSVTCVCVCVNPSRARAEQVSTTCWVNRPNMLRQTWTILLHIFLKYQSTYISSLSDLKKWRQYILEFIITFQLDFYWVIFAYFTVYTFTFLVWCVTMLLDSPFFTYNTST